MNPAAVHLICIKCVSAKEWSTKKKVFSAAELGILVEHTFGTASVYLSCKQKGVCEEILDKYADVISSTKRSAIDEKVVDACGRFLVKIFKLICLDYFCKQQELNTTVLKILPLN